MYTDYNNQGFRDFAEFDGNRGSEGPVSPMMMYLKRQSKDIADCECTGSAGPGKGNRENV